MLDSMIKCALILLSLSLAGFASGAERVIETAAGIGTSGNLGDDGPAERASLNQPFDVTLDRAGNVFFSDTFNHTIRRIDAATGRISTVAGSGSAGFSGDGGAATAARLNEPYGVVLDERNNLYIVDRINRRVRKVEASTGLISTVAGNGSKGYSGDGGPAAEAGLVEPNGVALDRGGKRLFIADVTGHRIRSLDLNTGIISTFAGTGAAKHDGDGGLASKASIWGARAVEVAPDGTIYILEREGNTLRGVDPRTGIITLRAGTGKKGFTGDGGPATAARLDRPHGVAVGPDGTFWIGDTNNHKIRRVRLVDSSAQ